MTSRFKKSKLTDNQIWFGGTTSAFLSAPLPCFAVEVYRTESRSVNVPACLGQRIGGISAGRRRPSDRWRRCRGTEFPARTPQLPGAGAPLRRQAYYESTSRLLDRKL